MGKKKKRSHSPSSSKELREILGVLNKAIKRKRRRRHRHCSSSSSSSDRGKWKRFFQNFDVPILSQELSQEGIYIDSITHCVFTVPISSNTRLRIQEAVVIRFSFRKFLF